MEYISLTKTAEGFRIEGFPNAIKVVRVTGPETRRLAGLVLHKAYLEFALGCIDAINQLPKASWLPRQALWRSAIVHFMKCFGESEARFSLAPGKVYQGRTGASEVFDYFKNLRDRHFVHDENSYAQAIPGAVIDKPGMDRKIAKIVCLAVVGDTLNQEDYASLHLLITHAQEWVVLQFDQLAERLTAELEAMSHDELMAMESVTYRAPAVADIGKTRPTRCPGGRSAATQETVTPTTITTMSVPIPPSTTDGTVPRYAAVTPDSNCPS